MSGISKCLRLEINKILFEEGLEFIACDQAFFLGANEQKNTTFAPQKNGWLLLNSLLHGVRLRWEEILVKGVSA